MPDDEVLSLEDFEMDEAIKENVRLGYFEVVGLGADGEIRYRVTEKGRCAVEAMMTRKQEPPKP